MMRSSLLAFPILCCVQMSDEASAKAPPVPTNHQESVINAFSVMCNIELPNFDHLAARAAAMRMSPVNIQPVPLPNGMRIRRGGWNGKLTTGPFTLLVDETSMPAGVITTCAVVSNVGDADAFRAEVIRELELGTEPRPTFLGGHRAFIFKSTSPTAPSLIIEDLTPKGQPGVMLNTRLSAQRL